MQSGVRVKDDPAHGEIRASDDQPTHRECKHPSWQRPWSHDPGPKDQGRCNHRIFLAQEAEEERQATPHDVLPNNGSVHRQADAGRCHELAEADHVRDRLHVDRMHGENQSGNECHGHVGETSRQRRDCHRHSRVPKQIHRMKEHRMSAGDGPAHRKAREGKWTIHLAAKIGWPIGSREAAPHALNRVNQRIPDDDVEVVHREAIPQGREMRNDRAHSDREVQPPPAVPSVHGSRRTASGRQTSDTIRSATLDRRQ